MTEVENDKLTSPSDEDNPQHTVAQPKRRDALSMFLLGVVGLLVLMYVLDWRAQQQMSERSELAHGLRLDEALGQRCRAESAGVDEQQLVLSCEGLGAQEVLGRLAKAKAKAKSADVMRFEQVAVRDAQATWVCRGDVAQWPDVGCISKPLPDRSTLERTRRRRQKE